MVAENEPDLTGPAPSQPADLPGDRAAESPPGGPPDAVPTPAEVEQLRADVAAAADAKLRAQAELENFRRRAARQMEEERRYAQMPLMRDLLPVVDNIRRAIEAAEKTEDAAGLLEGFKLVAKQLQDVLGRHDCTEIEALGAPFDPHYHHAISQQPSAEHPAGTVLIVAQPGFRLHDRVVRPSQVVVSAAPPEAPGSDHEEQRESDGRT